MEFLDFFMPKIKGKIGEGLNALLLKFLDRELYLVINDVYVPAANGKTSQIDHVVVSSYGIFVIETKNYKGWIFGDENSQNWTQIIYKEKHKFYNPIKQNASHIRALKNILKDYPNIPYVSIIAFSVKADLKKINAESAYVTYIPRVIRTIKSYKDIKIPMSDIKKIQNTIVNYNIKDSEVKKEHIRNIKNDIKGKVNKINNNICPWCEGKLVERNGKYGKFKGCSNYPKCRFVGK